MLTRNVVCKHVVQELRGLLHVYESCKEIESLKLFFDAMKKCTLNFRKTSEFTFYRNQQLDDLVTHLRQEVTKFREAAE